MTTMQWQISVIDRGSVNPFLRYVPAPLSGQGAETIIPYGGIFQQASEAAAIATFFSLYPGAYLNYGGYLFLPERISYPIYSGPTISTYLPDYSPSYAEYPYTVEAKQYSFTAFRGVDPPLQMNLIVSSGLGSGDAIPPPPDPEDPPEITIQLAFQNQSFVIKPSDSSVLTKYANPVSAIRAKFDTTRIGIIRPTRDGGFMIYEEVASAPVSPVYVYTYDRRLKIIATAAQIDQYA